MNSKDHWKRQGLLLIELRRYNNMTLAEMAAICKIPKTTLSRLERGERGITLDECMKLEAAFKTDVIKRLKDAAFDNFVEEWNHMDERLAQAKANAAGINHK